MFLLRALYTIQNKLLSVFYLSKKINKIYFGLESGSSHYVYKAAYVQNVVG